MSAPASGTLMVSRGYKALMNAYLRLMQRNGPGRDEREGMRLIIDKQKELRATGDDLVHRCGICKQPVTFTEEDGLAHAKGGLYKHVAEAL